MSALRSSKREIRFDAGMLILGLILLTLGLMGLWLGIRTISAREAAGRWPVCRGTVLDSKITARESETRSGTNVTYILTVTYEYRVGGTRYTSDRVIYTGGYQSPSPGEIRLVQKQYGPGTVVSVHYKPADPGVSLLIPGSRGDSGLALSAALGGAGIALISLLILIRAVGGIAGR